MLILWAWTALLSGFILFPLFFHQVNAIIPFGVAALGIGLYTFFHPGLRRQAEAEEEPPPADPPEPPGAPDPPGPAPPDLATPLGTGVASSGEPGTGSLANGLPTNLGAAPEGARDGFAVGRGGMR